MMSPQCASCGTYYSGNEAYCAQCGAPRVAAADPYQQNPYGQSAPQNPYGQSAPQQNPYGQSAPQQNAYGQPVQQQQQPTFGQRLQNYYTPQRIVRRWIIGRIIALAVVIVIFAGCALFVLLSAVASSAQH